jgi:hypothetical protein
MGLLRGHAPADIVVREHGEMRFQFLVGVTIQATKVEERQKSPYQMPHSLIYERQAGAAVRSSLRRAPNSWLRPRAASGQTL